MGSIDEQILRTTKEIVVKFIETGRISPTGVHETFREIYRTVEGAVKGAGEEASAPNAPASEPENQ